MYPDLINSIDKKYLKLFTEALVCPNDNIQYKSSFEK
jgi:hypothetical protein